VQSPCVHQAKNSWGLPGSHACACSQKLNRLLGLHQHAESIYVLLDTVTVLEFSASRIQAKQLEPLVAIRDADKRALASYGCLSVLWT
jgi:hypothetical protein